jgi:integrase
MPRAKSIPAYRLHKPSGWAVVTINGRDLYLGAHGSAESRNAYDRAIAEWLAAGRVNTPAATPVPSPSAVIRGPEPAATATVTIGCTVDELLLAFLDHARTYYRRADGTPTSEYDNFRDAVRPLQRLYGPTPAAAFGPLALKAVRQEMVKLGWARTYVNKHVGRVKRVFRHATENEMVPPATYQGLQAVAGLRAGRSDARETAPVLPVDEAVVAATLPHLSRQVRAMVELQLLTGMRPGEVTRVRPADLDRTGKLWLYRPSQHKTAHHGHARTIYLGPKAQAVVAPFLVGRPPERPLFSPADAVAERRAAAAARRTTPRSCGNVAGSNRKRTPRRVPGETYSVESYHQAVRNACKRADRLARETAGPEAAKAGGRLVPLWHPNQLRHSAATRLRKEFGLEAAQVILGHKTLLVTQVYAEKNVAAAQRVMADVG